MSKEIKKITLRQVVDAIRKERFPQHFGGYFDYQPKGMNKTRLAKACAVGQALYDLQIESVWPSSTSLKFKDAINDIITLNDEDRQSLESIADTIEDRYASILDKYTDAYHFERLLVF